MLPARRSSAARLPAHPRKRGRIAQLVEQLTLNQRVLGSSPSASTIFFSETYARCLASVRASGGPSQSAACDHLAGTSRDAQRQMDMAQDAPASRLDYLRSDGVHRTAAAKTRC